MKQSRLIGTTRKFRGVALHDIASLCYFIYVILKYFKYVCMFWLNDVQVFGKHHLLSLSSGIGCKKNVQKDLIHNIFHPLSQEKNTAWFSV